MNKTVAKMITERVIEKLKEGTLPWRKSWFGKGGAKNYVTKIPYRGINKLLLEPGYYISFKQLANIRCSEGRKIQKELDSVQKKKNKKEEGRLKRLLSEHLSGCEACGKLKKGAKYDIVFYWNWVKKEEEDETTGEKKVVNIPFLRYYRVYNTIYTNLEIEEDISLSDSTIEQKSSEDADELIERYSEEVPIHFGSDSAYYIPSRDEIYVPAKEQYLKTGEYYSTVFHEMIHSTGHEKRLKRDIRNGFGSERYSKEELIAELGASLLLSEYDLLEDAIFDNNAAYINSWIKKLEDDHTLIISAMSRAEKAAQYLLKFVGKEEDEIVEEDLLSA